MSVVRIRDAIVFGFEDTGGIEHHFACQPLAAKEIIARFVSAGDQAGIRRGETPHGPSTIGVRALIVERAGAQADDDKPILLVRLHASETGALDCALDSDIAQKLIERMRRELKKLEANVKKMMN